MSPPGAGSSPHEAIRARGAYFRRLGLSAMLMIAVAPWARGQQNATVVGTITDATGSVVPGVTISVSNVNTGINLTAITNSAGYYRVENLIPGQYTVAAEAKGFQKALRTAFTLEVAQTATIDLTLQLGSVTQTVEVTGTTPMLQAQTGSFDLGGVAVGGLQFGTQERIRHGAHGSAVHGARPRGHQQRSARPQRGSGVARRQ